MKEVDDIVMSVPGYADYCQLAYDDGTSANPTSSGCVVGLLARRIKLTHSP
jgi:hypothetical protein